MIYVENKDLVIPGQVLADDEYYSGRGTFKENGKVCSSLMGLVSLRNKKIRVIPLSSCCKSRILFSGYPQGMCSDS